MDLRIKDVADLLSVSESTIQNLLSSGKIPAYKIQDQYLFSRAEIENWVLERRVSFALKNPCSNPAKTYIKSKLNKILKTPSEAKRGSQQFSLFRAIHKGDVLNNIEGETKEELIRTASKFIAKELQFDAEVISDLLLDRENMQSTALSNGIGIPHPRDFLLHTTYDVVTVVFPKNPIDYGAFDGKPVHTLFFLFACQDKSHLHLLAKIAHFCNDPQRMDFLNTKPSKKEFLDYVKEWESAIV